MPLLETEVFVSSRSKTALMLLGSVAFVSIALFLPSDGGSQAWRFYCGGFCGLCAIVFAWLLARPQRLTLDADGFTLSGGLIRSAKVKKIPWRDVQQFMIYRAPGYRGLPGPKSIGMHFTPEAAERTTLARFNGRAFGVDGSLPGLWPDGPEKIVQKLNDYREQALRMSEKYGGSTAPPPSGG